MARRFVIAFGCIVACTPFSGADPVTATTSDAGGASVVDAGGTEKPDAAEAEAGTATGWCATRSPKPKSCFDFDTPATTPATSTIDADGATVVIISNGSTNVLLAKVTGEGAGGGSHAFFPVPINGATKRVHWTFDVLLNDELLPGMEITHLRLFPLDPVCDVEPAITDKLEVFENCKGSFGARTTHPIQREGNWWNFDITADFSTHALIVALRNGDGAPDTQTGPLQIDAVSEMRLELGLSFIDSNSLGATVQLDNITLDYE